MQKNLCICSLKAIMGKKITRQLRNILKLIIKRTRKANMPNCHVIIPVMAYI